MAQSTAFRLIAVSGLVALQAQAQIVSPFHRHRCVDRRTGAVFESRTLRCPRGADDLDVAERATPAPPQAAPMFPSDAAFAQAIVPDGSAWFCFDSDVGGACVRDYDDCVLAREAVAGPRHPATQCRRQPTADCFTFYDSRQGSVSNITCASAPARCEALRQRQAARLRSPTQPSPGFEFGGPSTVSECHTLGRTPPR